MESTLLGEKALFQAQVSTKAILAALDDRLGYFYGTVV